MTSVGTFEAKTHLTQLLGRVPRANGSHQPRAPLPCWFPGRKPRTFRPRRANVLEFETSRDRPRQKLTVRQMIEEGRRF